jgi:hypothetical protein
MIILNSEKSLVAFAINNFGAGAGAATALATTDSLEYFIDSYIKECLIVLTDSILVTEEAKELARLILKRELVTKDADLPQVTNSGNYL